MGTSHQKEGHSYLRAWRWRDRRGVLRDAHKESSQGRTIEGTSEPFVAPYSPEKMSQSMSHIAFVH